MLMNVFSSGAARRSFKRIPEFEYERVILLIEFSIPGMPCVPKQVLNYIFMSMMYLAIMGQLIQLSQLTIVKFFVLISCLVLMDKRLQQTLYGFDLRFNTSGLDGNILIVKSDGSIIMGRIKRGGLNGFGCLIDSTGSYYVGDHFNDMPHGEGKYRVNGVKHKGQFKNGQPHGLGYTKRPDGIRTRGFYIDGEASGWCMEQYPNGDRFEGEFYLGFPHGNSRVTYKNGDFLEGSYLSGKRHGTFVKFVRIPNEAPIQLEVDYENGEEVSCDRFEKNFELGQ